MKPIKLVSPARQKQHRPTNILCFYLTHLGKYQESPFSFPFPPQTSNILNIYLTALSIWACVQNRNCIETKI